MMMMERITTGRALAVALVVLAGPAAGFVPHLPAMTASPGPRIPAAASFSCSAAGNLESGRSQDSPCRMTSPMPLHRPARLLTRSKRATLLRASNDGSVPPPSFSFTPSLRMVMRASTLLKTIAGVLVITGVERGVAAVLASLGLSLPTAPIGMLFLFLSMCTLQAANASAAPQALALFGPAREFYKFAVPLFFSPPLVDLPLALLPLPASQIAKVFAVLAFGTVFTVLSSYSIVSALLPKAAPAAADKQATVTMGREEYPQTARETVTLARVPSPWPLAFAGLAAGAVFHAAGFMPLSIVALSLSALQVGKSFPGPVKTVCPPIVIGAAIVCSYICASANLARASWTAALYSYRAAGGPGLILLSQAAPAVVSLGFGLFEQRSILKKRAVPIAGGAAVTTLVSLFATVLFGRFLGLPSQIALGLSPRFITLPIALPIAKTLGASTSVAAMGTVVQGVLGANFAFRLLNMAGAKSPLARGFSVGSTSHALGTTAAYAEEPESGPPSAVTFLLCGVFAACYANIPAVRALLISAAGR